MGQLLSHDPPIIYGSENEKTEDEHSNLINLATCLLQWITDEQDVYINIKNMELPGKYVCWRCLKKAKRTFIFTSP